MDSRVFIRDARAVIARIQATGANNPNDDNCKAIQKDITALLVGLANPTLMTAADLVAAAQSAGYMVRQEVVNRINEAHAALQRDAYGI